MAGRIDLENGGVVTVAAPEGGRCFVELECRGRALRLSLTPGECERLFSALAPHVPQFRPQLPWVEYTPPGGR